MIIWWQVCCDWNDHDDEIVEGENDNDIQMVILFRDEWMRRGEDYLRKIVRRWQRRKLRISPEFIWDHEHQRYQRHYHQNLHIQHHQAPTSTFQKVTLSSSPSLQPMFDWEEGEFEWIIEKHREDNVLRGPVGVVVVLSRSSSLN